MKKSGYSSKILFVLFIIFLSVTVMDKPQNNACAQGQCVAMPMSSCFVSQAGDPTRLEVLRNANYCVLNKTEFLRHMSGDKSCRLFRDSGNNNEWTLELSENMDCCALCF